MLKKFGKKITKKGLLIAGGIAIALVAVIIAIAIISSKGEGTRKKNFIPDSELARAMTYDQFTDADASVNGTDYVKFGAFFLRDINNDGYAEKIKGTCKQVGKEDTLYMELNVLTNGYLENGVITINSDNFYLQTAIPKDSEVKDNVISNNTKQISLNQINNGTQKLLTGIVRTGDYSYDSQKFAAIGNDTTKYSKVNSVTLTGTHVAADGTRTQISKTVEFNMDWYGTTKAEIPSYVAGSSNLSQSKDNTNVIDEENKQAVFEFDIGMQETNNQLILSKAHLEGTIPQLNGYDPSKVEIVDSNATFSYEEATKTFQAEKLTELNTDRTVSKQCYDGTYYENRYNKFKLKVTYPLDAYNATGNDTVEIKIPVSGYYEGYNNTNTEFKKQHKSNIARGIIVLNYSRPTGSVARFDVVVGKYMVNPYLRYIVSKRNPLKIYNEISTEENNDTYIVKWYGSTGSEGQSAGMIMKETKNGDAQVSDQFIKIDSTTESMENITTNIGIYFGNPVNLLGENGWIKVYDDETGNLLHEFTKSDWSDYTENNPYKYNVQVKHVRVETSETNPNQLISIYHVKNLDDEYITKNYTREQFDNLKYINSTLTGYVGNSYINTDTHSAHYEAPYSFAKISLSKNAISTQETEKNMQIKIEAQGDENANQEKWQNGAFLVKLPKDIVDIDVSSVVSSTSSVTVMSYESFEENGERFIKIITSNTNPTTFTLTINCSVTPDPRIATTSENVELYASNENGVDYYNPAEDIYDVNDKLNKLEKINKSTVSLSLISPNSLLTNQVATNYDENGSVTVAPQIAIVSKERRNATVNVEINNNYSSTISEVKILGRVPFEGNKYTINGQEMGSTFTATMTNEGIQLPIALKDVAKVYYSTNGEATQDLTNAQNEWTQIPSDYSKVKSYLIDLGDHQLAKGEKHSISYNINIPAGLAYNKVAYSHHAVYFNLDTAEGKYRTQTEPNKIGFMIAKQYDLELTKFQKNKSKIVSGATYAVYEAGNEETRTRVTGIDGKLKLTGLYIDKTYVVKEIKSPTDYELNEEVVKFTTSESDGKLNVIKNEGTVKNIQAVQASGDEGYKVQIEVEDEAKAKLKIKKTEKGSATVVQGIGYKLIGAGLPTNGKNMTTNANGEITVKGLKVGEEYTLEETKAEGYYINKEKIRFTVTNTNGTYTVNVSEGTAKASTITEEDSIPTINLELEDEKIPTYDLEITKIKKVTSVTEGESGTQQEATTYLKDAKFKLYKVEKELGTYITDENGKLTIPGLYQYIDGKDEEATYTLKETLSPEGYSKVKDIIFKVDGSTGELKFVNTEGKEESYTVENNTVKLLIEDSPSFKLIKKDAETNELLANIKFAIYDVEEGTEPAKNSKGEIIGTKETINGKEYYTVTTDSKGEITADLPEGIYKAVEVQAPDKYDLSDSTYYFGIGASREGKTGIKATWAEGIGGIGGTNFDYINSVAECNDGGYIVGGYFYSNSIDLGNGISLTNKGDYDGMVIKYSQDGEVEWAKGIGGTSDDYIRSVAECRDGSYIVGGDFNSSSIDLGNGISLNNQSSSTSYNDGMIIKYNSSGEVEWAQGIGETGPDYINSVAECNDGGYIVGGDFCSSSIDLGNGIRLTNHKENSYDGMVIKLEETELPNPTIVQGKEIGGDKIDQITSVVPTSDGGYIVGGYFNSSSIDLGDGVVLSNKGSNDGMIIKYSNTGIIEWSREIGGENDDFIESVIETVDGGYIAVGKFKSYSIDLGNGVNLYNKGYDDGIVIKYNFKGEAEWAQSIYHSYRTSVSKTNDGGCILVGATYSSSIDLGNGVVLTNKGQSNGMIIKYSRDGEVEWAQGIGGVDEDIPKSVLATSDGGYLVGGYFKSNSIDLGSGVSLTNNGSENGMLIKYNNNGEVEWAHVIGGEDKDRINSITELEDGSYIAVGEFKSSNIDLDNGINLTNATGYTNGMIIKCNSKGETEWAKEIKGDFVDTIKSVTKTSDGGYIIGENFYSNSLELENGETLTNNGGCDVIIIKYSCSGKIEWIKGIGGKEDDQINSIAETKDGDYMIGGYFGANSIDLGNGKALTNKSNPYSSGFYPSDGMILRISDQQSVPEVQELEVTNKRKEFKITTDVNEIDGIKGGAISGEDRKPYENVKYGDSSTKEIKMVPDENYEIIGITVNGNEYKFTKNADGSYTMPQFKNITEDKHIVVTYSLKDNKIIINKIDKDTKAKLSGAKFKLDQIEERAKPNAEEIIGSLTDNGQEYAKTKLGNEITGKLGELTNNGTYYFVKNADGTYTPTNSKTYQTANGGTGGISSSTANSYISIDLTGLTGTYAVVINASCSSETNYDYGYATVTETSTAPAYDSATGRFIYVSGISNAMDYNSVILEGGKTYYLHLGYRKDWSGDRNNDQVVINSIKLYNATSEVNVYNFINNNGKYESTNIGKDDTVANSYIPIDLTKYTEKYDLTVNAEISSESSDYGYVTITENTTRPSYSSSMGRIVYISGIQSAKDYTTVLQGGKMYYLHLGYYKDSTISSANDKFTVNSVNISLNNPEIYNTTVETNSDGQAITQIPFGKYNVTEIKAPEGYILNSTPTVIEFKSANGAIHEFTIEDEAKAKLVVHHYIKGTTIQLADDENSEANAGDSYITNPKLDLDKYELEKDSNGEFILPTNAVGKYKTGTTEVIYYYVGKTIPLTVHHYIEGTTDRVPLKAGGTASDVTGSGKEGESYTTSAIEDGKLSDEYELVETPSNANGTYTGNEVVVTYYYKKVARDVNLVKYKEDGKTPLTGAKFEINGVEYTTDENGKIKVKLEVGTYEVTEIEAPEGYKLPENSTTEITITKAIPETINITNEKETGTVTVHHYIEGTTEKVPVADGGTADDEIKTGSIGDIYATKAREDLSEGYELVSEPINASGIITEEPIVVTYYYRLKKYPYTVNYLEKETDNVLKEPKQGEELTYGSTVTSSDEVIDIDGYNYDSVDKETLTITTNENVINIYYTKRTDLSYTVNYLEKDTNNVLHEQKVQDEMRFESVVNSSDEVIDIYGYNYDSVDKDTLTITTGENVINIYYTKKDTKVTVHYYEEGTTNKVSEDVEIPGKVFDNYETVSADDVPSKYELVAEPENKNGTMTEDEITVIYYYRKKATQVIVHYYEENTTKKLSEDVTINGRVDDKYTTVSAEDIPIKYELVAEPVNKSGDMTEATIEVIYYYRVKDAVVHVRYLEKGTDIVLADPDRLDGKVDEDYQTEAKDIEGYQLVEHTGNEKGKFEVEPITITYYYLYETKATVQYIDKITGQILEQSTAEGLEGDDFVTESKDFENYVLVEEPAEKTVKMTKEEQILKYYYIHVSGGVIEKHIDVISGQILANAVHNGNEGDTYDIPSRTFDGYDLVEDRLPSNAKGTMKVEPVEVIYYYIYRSKVTAEYIDKNTGEKLTDDVVQKGHEGDNYTTDRKTFDDYKLVEVPANADGSMTKEDIKVTYYYVHTSGGVIVNHIDIKTGKQLLDETKEEGYEGDPYETHEENIPEYDLVKEKYPENAVGKMTIEPTRVTYYYIKKTEVNVKYVDKETEEEIDEPTNIPGHEGDDYKTKTKDVPGYDLIEEPENKDGTMTADPIEVIYYYKRPAKVIVNYYDIDTKEKLADEIEITGHQNDDYTTEQKDIKYYEIAKVPENKEGKMIVTVTKDENGKDIVDDTTYVNYYYRKLEFNLRVDKTIASVIVNGQETVINGTLGKVEVHRKNISTANVKVVYKIKVTNDSELSGKANVVENIPSGMTMIADNNPGWTINETTASVETDEIKPGESREYQVVLGWQNGDGNIGTKENVASIVTENEAGFNEKDASDNESRADLIVAVGTGEIPYVAIAGSILLIMISITAGIYVIKKKHE